MRTCQRRRAIYHPDPGIEKDLTQIPEPSEGLRDKEFKDVDPGFGSLTDGWSCRLRGFNSLWGFKTREAISQEPFKPFAAHKMLR